jgi:hypothetical protein
MRYKSDKDIEKLEDKEQFTCKKVKELVTVLKK